jgi:glutamyl/glutaminyl-tRNA synthetase
MRYLPEALLNYLCLLGWSHPDEKDIFTLDEIVPLFDLERFIKSPALYDIQKLNYFNAEHLKRKPVADLVAMASETIAKEHPFHAQSDEWKETCLKFFVQKIQLIGELESQIAVLFKTETEASAEMNEIEGWETTSQMRNYLKEEVAKLGDNAFADAALFAAWGDHIKGELKIKGKPLFKGMRAVLTGQAEGPDLKDIIPLTPASVLKKRLGA